MATKIFRSVILGAPASGKGTISSRIINKFNVEHISSGDKLRLNMKNGTALGIKAKKYIDEGKLVPDSLMVQFIIGEINKIDNRNWLLDGFPRTINQAKELWAVQKLDLAINLYVPFDVIIERVKGRWVHLPSGRVYNTDFNAPLIPGKDDVTGEDLVQRADDKPEVVQKRLQQYEKMTRPVIEFYKEMGILQNFEGRTSNEIWPNVFDCLSGYVPIKVLDQRIESL